MGHKRVVHVIDDEADVCEALKVLLHTAGLEAHTYASAEEFLAEVKLISNNRSIACVGVTQPLRNSSSGE